MMKLAVFLAMVGAALAAPQGLDSEAEILPGGIRPQGSYPPRGDDDGGFEIFLIDHGHVNSMVDTFLRELFGVRGGPDGSGAANGSSADSDPPQDTHIPTTFFDSPFFTHFNFPSFHFPDIAGSPDFPDTAGFPDFHGDLPDNYDNSTHEVKVVNGSRVEVNRTVTKTTGDNGGVFITHIHTVRRLPEAETTDDSVPTAGDNPQGDDQPAGDDTAPTEANPADNQVEPYESFGLGIPASRNRRWILRWFKNALNKPDVDHNTLEMPSDKDAYDVRPRPGGAEEQPATTLRPPVTIPIRNHDDIAVNYIGAVPRPANPDAEIIDFDLIREDERRFFEGRSQPIMSQPMRTQPIMSQPMRTQPIMSQPMRSQPIMSQPMRSQPIMSQPMRSQPIMSQPIRRESRTFQPMRSEPLRTARL